MDTKTSGHVTSQKGEAYVNSSLPKKTQTYMTALEDGPCSSTTPLGAGAAAFVGAISINVFKRSEIKSVEEGENETKTLSVERSFAAGDALTALSGWPTVHLWVLGTAASEGILLSYACAASSAPVGTRATAVAKFRL